MKHCIYSALCCVAGCVSVNYSSLDSLSAGPWHSDAGSASVRRGGRSQPGAVRTRRGDVEHLPRLPVQARSQAACLAPALVCPGPLPTSTWLLRRQARIARLSAWIDLLPVDPGRLRRPPPGSAQSEPHADVLRQDNWPHAVSDGTQPGSDEDMGRRYIHRRRGLPAVPLVSTSSRAHFVLEKQQGYGVFSRGILRGILSEGAFRPFLSDCLWL